MRIDEVQDVIDRIARAAEQVALHAGVGGMEMAGMIISILADQPILTQQFLDNPSEFMISDHMHAERGRLTFHRRSDGKVTTPQELHAARTGQMRGYSTCRRVRQVEYPPTATSRVKPG